MRMVSRLIASQLRLIPLRVRVPLLPLSTWFSSSQVVKAFMVRAVRIRSVEFFKKILDKQKKVKYNNNNKDAEPDG